MDHLLENERAAPVDACARRFAWIGWTVAAGKRL